MDLRKRCRPGERLVHAVFLLVALMLAAQRIGAQPPPIISRIRIVGNQRVEEDAIRIHISAQPGQPLNDAIVDQDVKAIYRMGFFTDVHATVDQQGGQAILTYHVKERPLITDVRTEGMNEIKPTADEVVGAIKLHSGVIEDPQLVQSSIQALRQVYQGKGYLDADITFRTVPGANNTAIGVFHVSEGPLVEVSAHQVRRQQGVLGAPAERADGDAQAQYAEPLLQHRHARPHQAAGRRRSHDRVLLQPRLPAGAYRRPH